MTERRQVSGSSSRATGVRRNIFQHISRRPTTSSTSTSAETLRLDLEADSETDIVIRDKNGDYEVGDPPIPLADEQEEFEHQDAQEDESLIPLNPAITRGKAKHNIEERQRLADAVKHHQRDRNRPPSEPIELLEVVRASLRAKLVALADDNWMYEAEDDPPLR